MRDLASAHTDKANEFALDALKQIITLSSGILALTITFIKDALGDSRADAVLTFLVPLSWTLLFFSIPFSWATIVEAANTIAASDGKIPYVFDRHNQNKKVKKCLRFARYAQACFVGGMLLLAVFAISNFSLFFREVTPKSTENAIPQIVQPATPITTPVLSTTLEPTAIETPP